MKMEDYFVLERNGPLLYSFVELGRLVGNLVWSMK